MSIIKFFNRATPSVEIVLVSSSIDQPDQAHLTAGASCYHLITVEESGRLPVLRFGIFRLIILPFLIRMANKPLSHYARGWPSLAVIRFVVEVPEGGSHSHGFHQSFFSFTFSFSPSSTSVRTAALYPARLTVDNGCTRHGGGFIYPHLRSM